MKATVAVVNVANHPPRYTSEKLLQFETTMNRHLKAEGNLEQIRVHKNTSVRKGKNQILISEFGGGKILRHISTSERDPDRKQEWKISIRTSARPKMYRVK